MSYLKKYRTPAACYEKAPVRRENPLERWHRHADQLPIQRILNNKESK